jgi:hypothetical protein
MKNITGFIYFASFAGVISVFMSIFFAMEFPIIVPYFKRRGRRKTQLLQALQAGLFILLSACISFLAWAGVEGNVHPVWTVFAFAIIIIFLLFIAYVHRDFPVANTKFQLHAIQIGGVFYFIMLPGLICFAISYLKLMENAEYKVHDMMIKNTRMEFDGNYSCKGNKKCGAYKAIININWGNEWACPGNPDIWCDTWISAPDCLLLTDETFATKDEFSDNFARVESCVAEKYGLPAVGMELDKELYPELEEAWPRIQYLGTCTSTCSTEPLSTDMYEFVRKIKLAGLCLSCTGAILFAIYYYVIFGEGVKHFCGMFIRKPKSIFSLLRHSSIGRFLYLDRIPPLSGPTSGTNTDNVESRDEGRRSRRSGVSQTNDTNDGERSSDSIEVASRPCTPPMVEASILEEQSSDESWEEYSIDDEESFMESGRSMYDGSDDSSWDDSCKSESSLSIGPRDEDSCDNSVLSDDLSESSVVSPTATEEMDEVDIDV